MIVNLYNFSSILINNNDLQHCFKHTFIHKILEKINHIKDNKKLFYITIMTKHYKLNKKNCS